MYIWPINFNHWENIVIIATNYQLQLNIIKTMSITTIMCMKCTLDIPYGGNYKMIMIAIK